MWQAYADDEPMLRPTFLDHEHDVQTFEECDDFLLGRDILVASVVEQGERQRRDGCQITKLAGTISTTANGSVAVSGSPSTHRWRNCR